MDQGSGSKSRLESDGAPDIGDWHGDPTGLAGQHLLSLLGVRRDQMIALFDVAATLERLQREHRTPPLLHDSLMVSLFFQPSTRTRFGFEAAMHRLGGSVLSSAHVNETRAGLRHAGAYTEALDDMARTLSRMVDIAVMRHSEVGVPAEFARHAVIPVINAGDGIGPGSEHPTQALTDLYTMHKEFGAVDGLSVLVAGSLQLRVAHSLLYGLARFKRMQVFILCPPELYWTDIEDAMLRTLGGAYQRVRRIEDIIDQVDVIYHNGFTEEQMEGPRDGYCVNAALIKHARPGMIVMHPLPRDLEVDPSVDLTRHARYFQQVSNSIPMRMAILASIMGQAGAVLQLKETAALSTR
jgi:aspartate carbamoyltransferase